MANSNIIINKTSAWVVTTLVHYARVHDLEELLEAKHPSFTKRGRKYQNYEITNGINDRFRISAPEELTQQEKDRLYARGKGIDDYDDS